MMITVYARVSTRD